MRSVWSSTRWERPLLVLCRCPRETVPFLRTPNSGDSRRRNTPSGLQCWCTGKPRAFIPQITLLSRRWDEFPKRAAGGGFSGVVGVGVHIVAQPRAVIGSRGHANAIGRSLRGGDIHSNTGSRSEAGRVKRVVQASDEENIVARVAL